MHLRALARAFAPSIPTVLPRRLKNIENVLRTTEQKNYYLWLYGISLVFGAVPTKSETMVLYKELKREKKRELHNKARCVRCMTKRIKEVHKWSAFSSRVISSDNFHFCNAQ